MPFPGIVSVLFFLMLFSLGIDSAFSLVEALNVVIHDRYKHWQLSTISFWMCLAGFIAGITFTTRAGLYLLGIVDHFSSSYNLLTVGLFQAILVGWVYGAEKLRRYIDDVSDWQVGKWWNIAIKFAIPAVLVALLVTQLTTDLRNPYENYPGWALAIGWSVYLIPFLTFLIGLVRELWVGNWRSRCSAP